MTLLAASLIFLAICLIISRKSCPECTKRTPRSAHVCSGCGYRWSGADADAD
jgi:hypothetical protein